MRNPILKKLLTVATILGVVIIGLVVYQNVTAVWNSGSENKSWFYEQSAQDWCGLGHCSVLPATTANPCPYTGYSYSGGTCVKVNAYDCPSGYTKSSNGSCYQIYNRAITNSSRKPCPNGGTYNSGNDRCYKLATAAPIAQVVYYCSATIQAQGYTQLSGNRCYQKNAPGYTYSYGSCSPNSNYSTTQCIRYTSTRVCNSGTDNGSGCAVTQSPVSGDAKYATWALIPSGATNNSYFTGGATDKQKAGVLVDTLEAYYYGTHTNIQKVVNQSGSSLSNVKKYSKAGAAFVVHSMLGRAQGSIKDSSGVKNDNVTQADFDSLRAILISLASYIDWGAKISGNDYNTHSVRVTYQGATQFDVGQSKGAVSNRQSIVIKDSAGSKLFTLMYACANPFGSGQGVGDYDLYPYMSTDVNGITETSSIINANPRMENRGDASSSSNYWQASRFVLASGVAVPSGSNGTSQDPAQQFSGTTGFTDIGHGNRTFNLGSTDIGAIKDTVPNVPIGSSVCYVTSIHVYKIGTTQWRHSTPVCLTIGVKPKVQVWGSDLISGNVLIGLTGSLAKANVQTSTSVKDISGTTRTFGSWVEYAAQASGNIVGFGSGSAYAKPGLANSTACKASLLTFTNGGASTCVDSATFGGYVSSQPIPDVAASFPVTSSTTSLGSNPSLDLSNGSFRGIQTATGNVTISGGTIEAGRWFVLNAPTATVTITGNINYTSANISSIYNIPQVVIIARDINIRGSVTNVDSWLVARGTTLDANGEINTCSDVGKTAPLSISLCDKQLVVNGPVMATKLYLRRTYGAGQGSTHNADPAELFNTRADAYIWSYVRSLGNSRAQTVYSKELPPRL